MIADLSATGSSLTDVDVAVVGGGAAGLTVAMELVRLGRRVTVFEGGGDRETDASQSRYVGPLSIPSHAEYPPLDRCRARFLGGSTNLWNGWCRPLEANVFRPRKAIGDGWPISLEDLDRYYAIGRRLLHLGRDEWDVDALCRDVAIPVPFHATDSLARPVWRLSGPTRFAQDYRSALERDDLQVYLGANLVGFSLGRHGKVDLEFLTESREAVRVSPPVVVLAGGGIENSRLMLMLAALEPTLTRSGWLGAGFMEHTHVPAGYMLVERGDVDPGGRLASCVGLPLDVDGTPFRVGVGLTHEASARWGTANVSFTLENVTGMIAAPPFTSAVSNVWGVGTDPRVVMLFGRCEQRSSRDSSVSLAAERDDLGVRRGGLNWTISPEDLGDIYTASRLVAGELMKQGLGPIYLEALPGASRLTGGFHHMGGTRMSESPEHGVVDENLRVHGVPNLYVVGSSVFPTSCFSNPTLTIVALAARLASHLAEAG